MTATVAPAPVAAPAAPSALATGTRDLATMTRRSLRRMVRYPSLSVQLVAMPVVLLLLFVFVFGGAFGAGVTSGATPGAAGRSAYLDYITPAILVITAAALAQATAVTLAMGMTRGIVTPLRTMAGAPVGLLRGALDGAGV